jgi:hypothetical protein
MKDPVASFYRTFAKKLRTCGVCRVHMADAGDGVLWGAPYDLNRTICVVPYASEVSCIRLNLNGLVYRGRLYEVNHPWTRGVDPCEDYRDDEFPITSSSNPLHHYIYGFGGELYVHRSQELIHYAEPLAYSVVCLGTIRAQGWTRAAWRANPHKAPDAPVPLSADWLEDLRSSPADHLAEGVTWMYGRLVKESPPPRPAGKAG